METSFYKARNTLIEMLTDRGYTHPQGLASFSSTFEQFKELFKESDERDQSGTFPSNLDMFDIKDGAGKDVYVRVINGVFGIKESKIFMTFDKNKAEKSDFLVVANHYGLPLKSQGEFEDLLKKVHIILVYRSPVKKDSKYDNALELAFVDQQFEVFPVHKLTFNPTKHELVSKHILLSEEDKNKVTEKFNASKLMFHKMCIDDPINKYYGGKAGDMYEISRNGYRPAYRVVTARPLPHK